jgi:hypothetical protein
MNWDNLLTPLLFLLFIGVPLLNRLNRKRANQPRSGPSNYPQTASSNPTDSPPGETAGVGRQDNIPEDGDLSRRLEAARKRVTDATQHSGSEPPSSSPTSPDQRPLQGAAHNSVTSPPRDPAYSGTQPVSTVTEAPFGKTKRVSEPTNQPPTKQRFEISSGRRDISKTSKANNSPAILTSGKEILKGIIWKQILDEPKYKDPWRTPSQRR